MPNLTAKELTALKDTIGAEKALVKKYKAMACLCNDTSIEQEFDSIANKHQQHVNTLMTFLQ